MHSVNTSPNIMTPHAPPSPYTTTTHRHTQRLKSTHSHTLLLHTATHYYYTQPHTTTTHSHTLLLHTVTHYYYTQSHTTTTHSHTLAHTQPITDIVSNYY